MERAKQIWLMASLVGFGALLALAIGGWITFGPGPVGEIRRGPNGESEEPQGRSSVVNSYAPMVEKAAPSVVYVFTTATVTERRAYRDPVMRRFFGDRTRQRQEEGLGSGVIISREGYILTNHHVIEGADRIQVILPTTGDEFVARVVGSDPQTDIAVLKIEARELPKVTVGDSERLRVGDVVLAIGNPFGVGQSVTMGIVGAVSRGGFGITDYEDFIQTDASINPGNSGGALVDANGDLVGINTAILSRSGGNQGIGFSVPINMALTIMRRIIEDGRVIRGYLGVSTESLTPAEARSMNMPVSYGAVVTEVLPGTPAATAGLRQGDVIVQVDGTEVYEGRHLRLAVSQTRPGTRVVLKIYRSGELRNIDVNLAELPELPTAETTPGGPSPGSAFDPLSGVQIADVDMAVKRQLRIPASIFGALVVEVPQDSPAYESGLRAGNVIQEINRSPIRSAREALLYSRMLEDGQVLLRIWRRGEGSGYLVIEKQ